MEALRLENLSKYYTSESGVSMGLAGINLSFDIGEFVAVTGKSGSGKSTLAGVLGGILPYESGEFYLYGEPTSHFDSLEWERYRRDYISYISQSYGILVGNTVFENVESALILSGFSKEDAGKRTVEILREVELDGFEKRKAGKLSSGQKQRLSIARALAKPSRILIADEPTGNLDRENSEKIISLLKKASESRLVILITHEFSEAENHVTRRISLSDGGVVSDIKLRQFKMPNKSDENDINKTKKKLFPYITKLSMKSSPVFSVVVSLFLALTMVVTFVFLGTFAVALDDTNTKIYTRSSFYNGDPNRIVVMRKDMLPMTNEDYEKILGINRVENLEKCGYTFDISYIYGEVLNGETDFDWDSLYITSGDKRPDLSPYYKGENYFSSYIKTLPETKKGVKVEGSYAVGCYEIVSADPSHKTGDRVTVIIQDKNSWGISTYLVLTFDVVGTVNYGEGIYFSELFCKLMDNGPLILLPYDDSKFDLNTTYPGQDLPPLQDDEFYFTDRVQAKYYWGGGVSEGWIRKVETDGHSEHLTCAGFFESEMLRLCLVTQNTLERYINTDQMNQVSVQIKDYAYTDRVMDALDKEGYISVSPYRVGCTELDNDLAAERIITLAVSLAVLLFAFVLEIIICRAMFSTRHKNYSLLAQIGLTSKTAYLSLALELLIFTIIGEAIGFGLILLGNIIGILYISQIFIYLEFINIVLIFFAHFVSVLLVYIFLHRSLKKSVFSAEKRKYDLDFDVLEDSE